MKKVAGLAALAVLVTLPLLAQADGREGGRSEHSYSGSFNAPEIDGADFVLAMTLLAGVVGLVRRRSKSE
jgi:hypothetical protein